jgi:MerR family transcriptional regulator, light-induced transcriptional regulator
VRGTAVLACAPGERHELGLMMLAIALRRDGWKVTYLGADTPFEAAVALAGRQSARLLGISATTAPFTAPADAPVHVVLGGQAVGAHLGGLAETVSALRRFAA